MILLKILFQFLRWEMEIESHEEKLLEVFNNFQGCKSLRSAGIELQKKGRMTFKRPTELIQMGSET